MNTGARMLGSRQSVSVCGVVKSLCRKSAGKDAVSILAGSPIPAALAIAQSVRGSGHIIASSRNTGLPRARPSQEGRSGGKAMRQRPEIDGEYPQVAQLTERYEELKKAHQTLITPGDARALADLLYPGIEVYFRGYRGKSHYNRSGFSPLDGKFILYDTRPDSITLPKAGWGGRNYGPAVGKLRVGIVLHELAHVRARCPGHGELFVRHLDRLLDRARGLW